jgi:NADH-quinone oxidoreductase subunit G
VLAELSAALGHETGIESAPDALAAVADAVPFYAGVTDEEIGGRGVRWQDRSAAEALPEVKREVRDAGAPSRKAQSSLDGAPASPHLTLGTYRDLWAGPVTEHNPPLRFLAPVQTVEVSLVDAEKLGVRDGDEVTVGSNGTSVRARVDVRERVQEGVCFLIEGTSEGNANLLLNGVPQAVAIEKVDG